MSANTKELFYTLVDRNKKEVLSTLNHRIVSEAVSLKQRELLEKLRDVIEKSPIPTLVEDWFYYEIQIRGCKAFLILNETNEDNIHIHKDAGKYFLSKVKAHTKLTLLTIKDTYCTLSEYANISKVKESTLRQWINRGKIRTAEKIGTQWYIPASEKIPSYGFCPALYTWEGPLSDDVILQFQFLKGISGFILEQNPDNSQEFICVSNNKVLARLDSSQRRLLEYLLICCPEVEGLTL